MSDRDAANIERYSKQLEEFKGDGRFVTFFRNIKEMGRAYDIRDAKSKKEDQE